MHSIVCPSHCMISLCPTVHVLKIRLILAIFFLARYHLQEFEFVFNLHECFLWPLTKNFKLDIWEATLNMLIFFSETFSIHSIGSHGLWNELTRNLTQQEWDVAKCLFGTPERQVLQVLPNMWYICDIAEKWENYYICLLLEKKICLLHANQRQPS